jgi:hypothetical protein
MAFGIPGITPVEPPVYKLFITHAWDHQEYDSLVDLIKPDATFRWENLSVPKENPIAMLVGLPKSIRTLVHELDNRIRRADCVLIITGMYVAHRQWIQSEIESALDFKKPIVGIAPRGQERIPEAARMAIETARGELVRWNRESAISAIRRLSGLEPPTLENRLPSPVPVESPPLSVPNPPSGSLADALLALGLPPEPEPRPGSVFNPLKPPDKR